MRQLCDGVARHGVDWNAAVIITKRVAMLMKKLSSTYARRVRLSIYAIAAAVALTTAAFIAFTTTGGEPNLANAKLHEPATVSTSTR